MSKNFLLSASYNSKKLIQELLEKEGLAASKQRGQNFLIRKEARQKIFNTLEVQDGENIWEIGPGLGAMTELALEKNLKLSVFELDHGFCKFLKKYYLEFNNLKIIEGDFLKTFPKELDLNPDLIFGNLPYNSASAFLVAIIEKLLRPRLMTFTLQKEGALRICARPGSKNYSSFSALCNSFFNIKRLFDLDAESFWPKPRVKSSVVIFKPKESKIHKSEVKNYSDFLHKLFLSRRKTILNNLKSQKGDFDKARLYEFFIKKNLDEKARADSLDVDTLIELYMFLKV